MRRGHHNIFYLESNKPFSYSVANQHNLFILKNWYKFKSQRTIYYIINCNGEHS